MSDPTIWNQLLIWPITNILIAFYKAFEAMRTPWPMAFAVIGMTITIRLLLYPLMQKQMASARQMTNLKPKLDELTKKHKGDKKALQQAQLALYKEQGINPAAGCLPLLVQMPILIALYNVFYQVLGNGDLTKVIETINAIVYAPFLKLTALDLTFLNTNLGVKPSQWQTEGILLLSVPLITGLLQWYQTRLMMRPNAQSKDANQPSPKVGAITKKDEKPETDTAAEMQKQMALLAPVMFAVFAFQFPLGLSLYWNVFGLFGIMQQMKVNAAHQTA